MNGSTLYLALCRANIGGKKWPPMDSAFGRGVVACLDAEIAKEPKKRAKKEVLIDERAKNIFNVYPNRQGGQAALKAITESIAEDGFDLVLEMTTKYATACARYNKEDRKMIPHATTWYNNRRYKLDDPKTWYKGGGEPAEIVKHTRHIPAPTGWLVWATNKRAEWAKENDGYEPPGDAAILEQNFFKLPASWQQECREQLIDHQKQA